MRVSRIVIFQVLWKKTRRVMVFEEMRDVGCELDVLIYNYVEFKSLLNW